MRVGVLLCIALAGCAGGDEGEGTLLQPATGDAGAADAGGAGGEDAARPVGDAAVSVADAAAPARACNTQSRLSFVLQESYAPGIAFDTPFDCGGSGHLLLHNGPPENRVNLVVLGDGYRQEELATRYQEHVQRFVDHMFSSEGEPYLSYAKYFNVCSLDVASNQSGTDIPDEGVWVDTVFDGNGSDATRLGLVDDGKVRDAMDQLLAGTRIDPDYVAVTLNVNRWFNSGGWLMIWSGARPGKPDVALHEGGHSFHGLADEYGGNAGSYSGPEVREPNVTIDASGARWQEWLGYDQPGVGLIGAYEGGRYYDHGIYRPSPNSKMNIVPAPHNAPSMQKIVQDIYRVVRPVDAWTENSGVLDNPCALELTLVDAARVDVTWSVNGAPVDSDEEARFDVARGLSEAGTYTIEARVHDPTAFVRTERSALEQTIRWSVSVP